MLSKQPTEVNNGESAAQIEAKEFIRPIHTNIHGRELVTYNDANVYAAVLAALKPQQVFSSYAGAVVKQNRNDSPDADIWKQREQRVLVLSTEATELKLLLSTMSFISDDGTVHTYDSKPFAHLSDADPAALLKNVLQANNISEFSGSLAVSNHSGELCYIYDNDTWAISMDKNAIFDGWLEAIKQFVDEQSPVMYVVKDDKILLSASDGVARHTILVKRSLFSTDEAQLDILNYLSSELPGIQFFDQTWIMEKANRLIN